MLMTQGNRFQLQSLNIFFDHVLKMNLSLKSGENWRPRSSKSLSDVFHTYKALLSLNLLLFP